MQNSPIYCIECEDVLANVECLNCGDVLCDLCFGWLHKTGTRKDHGSRVIRSQQRDAVEGTTAHFVRSIENSDAQREKRQKVVPDAAENLDYAARAKYIPLRLSAEERRLFHLLEGALHVSEYTDKVDVAKNDYGYSSWGFISTGHGGSWKENIIKQELEQMFGLMLGLYVGSDFRAGQRLAASDFEANQAFFARVFEIGRRYKIMNPDKMRTTYGKLMHLLQDAVREGTLSFSVKAPIRTVGLVLEEAGAAGLLAEAALGPATREGPHRAAARAALAAAWPTLGPTLDLVLDSIADANSYISSNVTVVDKVLYYLGHYFEPDSPKDREHDLSIQAGSGGSCLTHNHATQFKFVQQSLKLWREIQFDMYKLWVCADADLLSEANGYRLVNTGQGLNRMQAAPNVSRAMQSILGKVQQSVRGWVGLSVVHLGDRDVPNALFFIDKYTQVPRILTPIIHTVEELETISQEDPQLREMFDSYEGVDRVQAFILRDYFRHGFDGSGDDGGSCVDGRLTSSWNWTSHLEKKAFHHLFMLAGFEGFDGSFK